jgi:diaminopimelate decarboxylase
MTLFHGKPGLEKVLPVTAELTPDGHLAVGGCDVVELAREFGTPLYVFDEVTLRGRARTYREELGRRYGESLVVYAAKAFINRPLARLLADEGLGLDVVSGGEVAIAHAAGFPMERVYFHGNNKTPDEVELALKVGVGRFVIDNLYEVDLLNRLADGRRQPALIRLTPGIDPHTHQYITTGVIDTKFGLPISTGQAEEAVRAVLDSRNLELVGFHVHIGSQIFDLDAFRRAVDACLDFAGEMVRRYGIELREFSPGGGLGIPYLADDPTPEIGDYIETVCGAVKARLAQWALPRPRLIVEPGRSIIGPAGVAVYRVGAVKTIPGVRTYVAVDGGMADNIRPALYGARYEAVVANRAAEAPTGPVTVAGKYCESGDILIRDVVLPPVEPGDILVLPAAGAYCLAMASNYNAALKPAVVLVSGGRARLIRRRETYEDLLALDVVE